MSATLNAANTEQIATLATRLGWSSVCQDAVLPYPEYMAIMKHGTISDSDR